MLRNFRIGPATNSSSSHSVIVHPARGGRDALAQVREALPPDGTAERTMPGPLVDGSFVLADPTDRALYLLSGSRMKSLSAHERLEVEKAVAARCDRARLAALMEEDRAESLLEYSADGYLDTMRAQGVSPGLAARFFLSDDVTVYGYDDADPPLRLTRAGIAASRDGITRYRQDGDALIGYDPERGTKFRWSESPYEKASAPELVDVKITDYCAYGCAFCYQGSTKQGVHAPLARLKAIFDQLAAMGVFEVAMGGGEPCHHPDFEAILEAGWARGLTMNFTAFGLDWTKSPVLTRARRRKPGAAVPPVGVGVSVHGPRDLAKLRRAEAKRFDGISTVLAQTVIGATPFEDIEETLEAAMDNGLPLLLLGYKPTGRGVDFGRLDVDRDRLARLIARAQDFVAREDNGFHLSVDTAFLDDYGDVLDECGIWSALRSGPEGAFSMYVDAVTDRCGPSSYCDAQDMPPIGDLTAQFAAY